MGQQQQQQQQQQLNEPLFKCYRKNPLKCNCSYHNNGLMNSDEVVFRSNHRSVNSKRVLSESELETEEEEEKEEGGSLLQKFTLRIPDVPQFLPLHIVANMKNKR